VRRAAIHALLAGATLAIGSITVASGDVSSPYPLLYFWVATSAFCFLRRIEAAAHALLIAGAYAAGLALAGGATGASVLRWTVLALALAVGGTFIGAVRARHDQLMDELRSVSRVDAASGLLDGRGFDEAIANELERARRSGSRFGVIRASVDGFDALPAAERRAVLARVGETIASAKRDIDVAARLDHDDFVVIATYTDERGAQVLADRICAGSRHDGATLSLGVVCHPRHGATAPVLLSAAREARDEATRVGGDRSIVAVSSADWIAARADAADVQVVSRA
jgi:diguanylate cyclase (GGDEF)-like protein